MIRKSGNRCRSAVARDCSGIGPLLHLLAHSRTSCRGGRADSNNRFDLIGIRSSWPQIARRRNDESACTQAARTRLVKSLASCAESRALPPRQPALGNTPNQKHPNQKRKTAGPVRRSPAIRTTANSARYADTVNINPTVLRHLQL